MARRWSNGPVRETKVTEFETRRDAMVEEQLRRRGIADREILDAFRAVPRELFVAPAFVPHAYDDHPLPIEAGQTISQPYIVALMIQAAALRLGDRVLEVGAGSGYAAAVVSRIAGSVVAIERHAALARTAQDRLDRLGYANVTIVEGDGSCGWAEQAPYDAILVAASGSHVPQPLIDQLAPGGRLVMPVGDPGSTQRLVKVTMLSDGSTAQADLGEVRFVPLIGEHAWRPG